MNRKGSGELATFVVTVIGLILLAIITLKVTNSILTPFEASIGNVSSTAGTNVNYVHTTFTTFWDYLILIAIFVNMIMLFIFSFLADTNPVFVVLYIIVGVVMLGIAPYAIEPAKQIFGMSAFSTEILQLPLTSFVVTYFHLLLFAVYFVTGIILYAKFRGRSSDL